MKKATKGKPTVDFTVPTGVVTRTICPVSHKLANQYCPNPRKEVYLAGTEPTEICDIHTKNGVSLKRFSHNPLYFEKLDRETMHKNGF